jgi:hypothetical protein
MLSSGGWWRRRKRPGIDDEVESEYFAGEERGKGIVGSRECGVKWYRNVSGAPGGRTCRLSKYRTVLLSISVGLSDWVYRCSMGRVNIQRGGVKVIELDRPFVMMRKHVHVA